MNDSGSSEGFDVHAPENRRPRRIAVVVIVVVVESDSFGGEFDVVLDVVFDVVFDVVVADVRCRVKVSCGGEGRECRDEQIISQHDSRQPIREQVRPTLSPALCFSFV